MEQNTEYIYRIILIFLVIIGIALFIAILYNVFIAREKYKENMDVTTALTNFVDSLTNVVDTALPEMEEPSKSFEINNTVYGNIAINMKSSDVQQNEINIRFGQFSLTDTQIQKLLPEFSVTGEVGKEFSTVYFIVSNGSSITTNQINQLSQIINITNTKNIPIRITYYSNPIILQPTQHLFIEIKNSQFRFNVTSPQNISETVPVLSTSEVISEIQPETASESISEENYMLLPGTIEKSKEEQIPGSGCLDNTKQFYKKYEEIMLPSSLQPYIGRDRVAYRGLLGKQGFVSKRPGVMACQVDTSNNWQSQNYDGTMTNVVATCAYTINDSSDDPNIWTKSQCMTECGKLQDIM
ncbi:MAG: hypothetical protein Terrestrivirus3_32 [Terrestrivirus sp.]|uniref:Uncharacterized protein n=1 Tax=Terrestrivirus sp. TaxID=2487775 RepID=A0A3G4ZQ78_9VIRU|nr:MAG: hypothetical protein Terrestrivirus3_32 [Terrestrivirus sp.]